MKLSRLYLLIMVVAIPVTGMAQQITDNLPVGKILSKSDSLSAVHSKPAADSSQTVLTNPGNYWFDPIGDEEEMDSWENMEYNDSTPFWLELNPDRDYDPPDQREREQEQDGRD